MRTTLIISMLLITLLPGMPSNSSDLSMGEAALRAKNYSKAFEIYEPLAKEGIAEAQFALGLLLSEGLGGPLNTKKATQLWMLAAENKNGAITGIKDDGSEVTIAFKLVNVTNSTDGVTLSAEFIL